MPKVSVVIPTYNRAGLLKRAVNSVLSQTFADLEVLIVDDRSPDDTAAVVEMIDDSRVRYFRHPTNRGVSASRNTALSHATGKFVAFLDDDDEWLPDKLSMQLGRLERAGKHVGLICSGYHEIEYGTGRVLCAVTPHLRGWVFEDLLRQGYYNHTSSIVARIDCFDQVGAFDLAYDWGEDFDMWLRIAQAFEFDFVEAPLMRFHLLPGGLTRNFRAEIKGTHAHLSKYQSFFERHPRILNARLHRLASCYCFVGDTKQARRIFCQAIAQHPLAGKTYLAALLSLTGPEGVRLGYATKAAVADMAQSLLGRIRYTRWNSFGLTS
jgi:glycosyltransferase involved in cell wall biosynthesis